MSSKYCKWRTIRTFPNQVVATLHVHGSMVSKPPQPVSLANIQGVAVEGNGGI
jgi:hypothetical protein